MVKIGFLLQSVAPLDSSWALISSRSVFWGYLHHVGGQWDGYPPHLEADGANWNQTYSVGQQQPMAEPVGVTIKIAHNHSSRVESFGSWEL